MKRSVTKLPPFGKHLFNLIKCGTPPRNDIWLFMGHDSWKKATAFQICHSGTLCLPPYDDPSIYLWPVYGCDILIFDTSYSSDGDVDALNISLFRDGANIIRFVSTDLNLNIFKKDF